MSVYQVLPIYRSLQNIHYVLKCKRGAFYFIIFIQLSLSNGLAGKLKRKSCSMMLLSHLIVFIRFSFYFFINKMFTLPTSYVSDLFVSVTYIKCPFSTAIFGLVVEATDQEGNPDILFLQ